MVMLLPLAWIACLLLWREAAARRWIGADWRLSFLLAAASWGTLLALGTELLSALAMLDEAGLESFWVVANVGLWTGLIGWRRRSPAKEGGWTLMSSWNELRAWPWEARVMLGAAGAFAVFLGGIALFTTTTNWDSLTYHMARVMHWMQQQSVAHYPTNMDGQLQMGPWPAFAQTHLWLLWGNDHLENMVQWSAMAGCMITATLLARQLLPGDQAGWPLAEAFAALLVVTLPTGIVEAITTQTDFVTAFWLVGLASMGLAWHREPRNRAYAIGFGAVLGLGVMTKFTMVVYAAPVGLATAAALVWKLRPGVRQLLLPATASLVVCIALVLPHFLRNEAVYGSVVGSQAVLTDHGVPHASVSGVVFNVFHNLELQTSTGFEGLTHVFNQILHALEKCTGRSADDPGLSIHSSMYEAPDEFFVFDSFAASPWHMLLIGAAAVMGLAGPRQNRLALMGLGLAGTGFVLICALLRWQIWSSHYHLPVLVLFLPAMAAILAPRINRWCLLATGAGLLAFGLIIVAHNRSRPIFDPAWRAEPRLQQMFSFQGTKFYQPMRLAATQIAATGCEEVGLKLWGDHPEYPLWLMLREAGFKGKIHHALVEGPSAKIPASTPPPDVIVTSLEAKPSEALAAAYPTSTKIGPTGEEPVIILYWSVKMSERRAQAKAAVTAPKEGK
jgi:hypothetical protein